LRLPFRIPRPRIPRERPPLLAVVLLVLVAAGVAFGVSRLRDNGSGETRTVRLLPPQAGGRGEKPQSRRSFLERLIPPPNEKVVKGPGVPRSLADLVNRLPLERKVAQLILAGFRGQDLTAPIYEELRRIDLGGVVIEGRNYQNPTQLAALAGETGVVAKQAGHVPPLVFAPQEGGEFSDFPDLPPTLPLSQLPNAAEGGKEAFQSGQSLRALGIHGVLGPVVDVGTETGEDAIGPRAFSDDPAAVARFARAALAGYARAGVIATPKHFPGLGSASIPTDQGPSTVGLSLQELEKRDLVPFNTAIRAGAPAILLSHALYAPNYSNPGSLSPAIVTQLLRRQLHFRGIAITDDLAAPAITADWTVPDAATAAIRAGADMVWISGTRADQEATQLALVNAVRRGEISVGRLNEALLRVLSAKQRYGLIQGGG
jgi:beta-N-acetylhexosaminidase